MFNFAGQPDIVRAAQKDSYFLSTLQDDIREFGCAMFGGHRMSRYEAEVDLMSSACYYGLTTLIACKTLGEEYCDILQVNTNRTLPTAQRRTALVALQILGPYLFQKARESRTSRTPPPRPPQEPLLAKLRRWKASLYARILRMADAIARAMPTLERGHLALFYLFGAYLHWANRALGIRYVFLRRLHRPRPGYQILGLLLVIQMVARTGMWARARIAEAQQRSGWNILGQADEADDGETRGQGESVSSADDDDEPVNCVLCLETRRHTTATDCGHLFCWSCIAECVTNKPECPLCRQPQTLSRLLRLCHYKNY